MPAGMPYFAWIDPSETVFTSGHMRWDEAIFSFKLSQNEGDPANLTAVVRRPRNVAGDPIGLLGPGRKIWIWFAFDCGPDLIRFRGRLVGVPTSLFEDLVTLEFIAKPIDLVSQKAALADSLRVLPFYDDVVIDPQRRDDPDLVLEGYTKIWHYDRETHILTVSDEITGEDGTIQFDGGSDDGKVLYDGLGLTLTSGPLSRVDVNAEYNWTQQAQGSIDLTGWLAKHFTTSSVPGAFTSYTFTADNWPKAGASLGNGWTVTSATAYELYDWTVKTTTETESLTIIGPDGSTSQSSITATNSYVGSYAGTHAQFPAIVTKDEWQTTYGKDGDGLLYPQSTSRSVEAVGAVLPEHTIKATLVAGYTAQRPCIETVSLTLFANVQHILTDPADGEALQLADIRSVNLSEGTSPAIGDPGRRSYISTSRGNQSIQYLICLAKAQLMRRARVVEIAFAPKLSRICEVTLRKNAFLSEPRVGNATGKIIGYSLALDGSNGKIDCEIRIGCAIGYGGFITAVTGTPTYCDVAYTGPDYQQFINRTVLLDSSVGYSPVNSNPQDDGIIFLGSGPSLPSVVVEDVAIENDSTTQRNAFANFVPSGMPTGGYIPAFDRTTTDDGQKRIAARDDQLREFLKAHETTISFKLSNMNAEFSSDYTVQMTDLEIPQGYNLEAT
jgi:hypothetical protein